MSILLDLHLARPDESYEVDLEGSKWGHDDQRFYLGSGRLGLWQFGFEWDETPHIYSTTGRTLATETARGVWTLPTPRPSLPTWNSGRDLGEIGQRWDTAHLFLAVTPTPNIDFRADYSRIRKDGERPFSVPFGSPGNNFLEILAPIEQTVHDFRLRGTLARETWQIQAGYTFSMFKNDEKSLTVDNPCFGLAAAVTAGGCGGDAAGAPRIGLVSLEPSNMAHTWSLGGARWCEVPCNDGGRTAPRTSHLGRWCLSSSVQSGRPRRRGGPPRSRRALRSRTKRQKIPWDHGW